MDVHVVSQLSETGHGDPEQPSHRAAGPVGRHDVAARHLDGSAALPLDKLGVHTLGRLPERAKFDAESDVGDRVRDCLADQDGLERELRARRPFGRADVGGRCAQRR